MRRSLKRYLPRRYQPQFWLHHLLKLFAKPALLVQSLGPQLSPQLEPPLQDHQEDSSAWLVELRLREELPQVSVRLPPLQAQA